MLGFNVISHHFGGETYCKLMMIKEDHEVESHKHAYDHLSILCSGIVIVEADGIQTIHYSPDVLTIKAGVVHKVIAVNGPAVWACVHKVSDDVDRENIDEVLIQKVE